MWENRGGGSGIKSLTSLIMNNGKIIASGAERSEANSQESFSPKLFGIFKKRDISETIDFFDMV